MMGRTHAHKDQVTSSSRLSCASAVPARWVMPIMCVEAASTPRDAAFRPPRVVAPHHVRRRQIHRRRLHGCTSGACLFARAMKIEEASRRSGWLSSRASFQVPTKFAAARDVQWILLYSKVQLVFIMYDLRSRCTLRRGASPGIPLCGYRCVGRRVRTGRERRAGATSRRAST